MEREKILALSFVLIFVILFSLVAFAFTNHDKSPSIAGNGTTIKMVEFNVSTKKADGSYDALNVTTVNLTGGSTASANNITNITLINSTSNDGAVLGYNDSINSFPANITLDLNIPGDTNLTLNFTINGSATDNKKVGANVTDIYAQANVTHDALPYSSSLVTIDSLPPNATYEGQTLNASSNNTGNLTINVTGHDTVSNIANISIYVNNTLVKNCTGTSNRKSCYYTNNSNDGVYKINATVKDNATGNQHTNKSLSTRTVTIDNTAPTISLSKSSSTTSSITVSYSCSDATSGKKSCSLSSSSGTVSGSDITGLSCGNSYTITVDAKDYAGKTNTKSSSYSTDNCGGGGGYTPSFWDQGTDYVVRDQQFQEGFTKVLGVADRFEVSVDNEEHHVGVTDITDNKLTIEVSSDPQQVEMSVGDLKKFELTDDNYYDLSVELLGIENNEANLTIQSIHEEIPEEEKEAGEEAPAEEGVEEGEAPEEVPSKDLTWLWILIVVLVIVIIVYVIYVKSSK